MKQSDYIYFVERNVHGAWVVYGELGIRQYYYHTKAESIREYVAECKQTIFIEER